VKTFFLCGFVHSFDVERVRGKEPKREEKKSRDEIRRDQTRSDEIEKGGCGAEAWKCKTRVLARILELQGKEKRNNRRKHKTWSSHCVTRKQMMRPTFGEKKEGTMESEHIAIVE